MPKKIPPHHAAAPIAAPPVAASPVAPTPTHPATPTTSDFTYLNVLIDRSGSMQHLKKETVGGFNKFLTEQKAAPGKALMRLAYFDSNVVVPVEGLNIKKIKEITEDGYWQGGGGWTALFDALGATIEACKKHIDSLPIEDRPAKVMFLIITDGQENSSKRFTADQIKNLVTEARTTHKWEFTFLGANIDAITEAAKIGISRDFAASYSADAGGTHAVYHVASSNMLRSRGMAVDNHGMVVADKGFSDLDRNKLMNKKAPDPIAPKKP